MGRFIQLLTVGDDMGTQHGPLCNPRHIERFCMPYYRRFCRVVHAESDVKVFMHNRGVRGGVVLTRCAMARSRQARCRS
jgi:uroporphyrinogen decarboxylase